MKTPDPMDTPDGCDGDGCRIPAAHGHHDDTYGTMADDWDRLARALTGLGHTVWHEHVVPTLEPLLDRLAAWLNRRTP